MNKIFRYYCKAEEAIVGAGFVAIVAMTFMNAVLRIFNCPIVYADDVCLLLFSWTAFLGADVAMRHCRLVGMDILTKKFAPKVQKILGIIVYAIMIAILVILIKGGIAIIIKNGARPFNTLASFGITYSAVNAALPVCGALLVITCLTKIGKLISHFADDAYNIKKDVPDATLGEENAGLDQTPLNDDDNKEAQ